MKRLFFVAACAASLSFVACNNADNKGTSTTTDSTQVNKDKPTANDSSANKGKDSSATASTSSATNDVDKALDTYEANITKYVDIMKKAQSGDASAATDAQKIGTEMATAAQTLGTKATTMSAAQSKRLTDLGKKYAEAMQAAMKK